MSKFNEFMLQWGTDKFLHFMAGAAGFAITGSWIILGILAFGKEIYDKYNSSSGWSNPDIVATLLGGVSAWLGIQVWNWLPHTELVW